MLLHQPAHALDIMEAIGAEKCERGVRSYATEFLAPGNATLEAEAKVVVKGTADIGSVTLSLDGKDCMKGRCGFQAKERRDLPALGCSKTFGRSPIGFSAPALLPA